MMVLYSPSHSGDLKDFKKMRGRIINYNDEYEINFDIIGEQYHQILVQEIYHV